MVTARLDLTQMRTSGKRVSGIPGRGEVSEERMNFETGKFTAEYSEMIGSTPGIWALISASISSGLDSLSCTDL